MGGLWGSWDMAYTYIYIYINTYNMHIYIYICIHTYTFIDQIRASPAVGPVGFVDLTSPAPRCRFRNGCNEGKSFGRCPKKEESPRVQTVFFFQGTSPRWRFQDIVCQAGLLVLLLLLPFLLFSSSSRDGGALTKYVPAGISRRKSSPCSHHLKEVVTCPRSKKTTAREVA